MCVGVLCFVHRLSWLLLFLSLFLLTPTRPFSDSWPGSCSFFCFGLSSRGVGDAEEGTEPRLLRFMGRPDDTTPKALAKMMLGHPLPFDRHDWVVDRGGGRGEAADLQAGFVCAYTRRWQKDASSLVSFDVPCPPGCWQAFRSAERNGSVRTRGRGRKSARGVRSGREHVCAHVLTTARETNISPPRKYRSRFKGRHPRGRRRLGGVFCSSSLASCSGCCQRCHCSPGHTRRHVQHMITTALIRTHPSSSSSSSSSTTTTTTTLNLCSGGT